MSMKKEGIPPRKHQKSARRSDCSAGQNTVDTAPIPGGLD